MVNPAPRRRIIPAAKPAPKPAVSPQAVAGRSNATSVMKHKGAEYGHRDTSKNIPGGTFPEGAALARVRVAVGQTFKVGDYESLRVDVDITMPCLPEDVQATYESTSEKVAELFTAECDIWLKGN